MRTNSYQVRTGDYSEEAISIYLIVRRYWGDWPQEPMESIFAQMAQKAESSCERDDVVAAHHPADLGSDRIAVLIRRRDRHQPHDPSAGDESHRRPTLVYRCRFFERRLLPRPTSRRMGEPAQRPRIKSRKEFIRVSRLHLLDESMQAGDIHPQTAWVVSPSHVFCWCGAGRTFPTLIARSPRLSFATAKESDLMKRHLLQYLFDGGERHFTRQEQRKVVGLHSTATSNATVATPERNNGRVEQSPLQSASPHQRPTALRALAEAVHSSVIFQPSAAGVPKPSWRHLRPSFRTDTTPPSPSLGSPRSPIARKISGKSITPLPASNAGEHGSRRCPQDECERSAPALNE